MNKVHKDGRPLLTLSAQVKRADRDASKTKVAETRQPPSPSIQRQDTDYDVKPEIPAPRSGKQKPKEHRRGAHNHQAHAAMPDSGVVTNATQMGETESENNYDARDAHARALRAICI